MKPSCYTCQKYCDCIHPPILSAIVNHTIRMEECEPLDYGKILALDGTTYDYDVLELKGYEEFAEIHGCYEERNK